MQGLFTIMMAAIVLSGCAGVMNPYSGDFQCPETGKGKCVSVRTAYKESAEKKENSRDAEIKARAE